MPSETPAASVVTAPSRRDPALDGLRGFAVLMVFLFHYGGGLESKNPILHTLGYVTQASWIGIVLFFALSGFLITGSLWDSISEKFLLRNFFIRRGLRILPLYFVALLISFIGALANGLTWHSIKAFLIYTLFLQDLPFFSTWALQYNSPYPLYHLWSVAVEEQFYLLWPLFLIQADNRRVARTMCLRFFGLSAFFRLLFSLPDLNFGQPSLYSYFLFSHAGALALGGAVALALRSRDSATGRIAAPVRFLRRYAVIAFFSGLTIFIVIGLFFSFLDSAPMQFMFGLLGVSVSAAALIVIVLRPGRTRSFFSIRALAYLGRVSYGFYIFHILLQPWFDKMAFTTTSFTMHTLHMQGWSVDLYQFCRMVVAFGITLATATLSFYLIEAPLMRFGRRFPLPSPLPSGLHLFSGTRRDPYKSSKLSHDFTPVSREDDPRDL